MGDNSLGLIALSLKLRRKSGAVLDSKGEINRATLLGIGHRIRTSEKIAKVKLNH